MFEYIKRIISPGSQSVNPMNLKSFEEPGNEKKIQVATCALFVELAKSDGEFSDEERKNIISTMKKFFHLDSDTVAELLELSEESVKHSISLYEFSNIINENFTNDEKYLLMKNLWKLVYIDDKLHMYEDYMIKKIGATLNMDHKNIINAKLAVKEEMEN